MNVLIPEIDRHSNAELTFSHRSPLSAYLPSVIPAR
jgi:hypothetical protein